MSTLFVIAKQRLSGFGANSAAYTQILLTPVKFL